MHWDPVKVKMLVTGLLWQRSNISMKWLPSWSLHNGSLIVGMVLCKTLSQLPRTSTVNLNMIRRPWVGCLYLPLQPVLSLGTVFTSEIQSCWRFSSSNLPGSQSPTKILPQVVCICYSLFLEFSFLPCIPLPKWLLTFLLISAQSLLPQWTHSLV